ncbi:MAG: hypothetical protein OXU96_08260 [Gammaproteobacteria bacterium]|nr:hypothetical protein [Gammaproteobacteria bacterium]MDD9873937.1 hypothetical protein [Gammaproteobacteria bacterium]
MQIKNTAFFALTLFFASALAGCGGGGGGSSGTSGSRVSLNTLSDTVDTSTARSAARNFAGATPRAGSVTQTSNTNNAGVTQDTIAADARYGAGGELVVTVRRTDSENAAIALGNDGNSPGTVVVARDDNLISPNNNRYRGRVLGRATAGGIAFTRVFTDRLTQADTDYLVGGVWLLIPDGAASTRDLEIGAFADGPNANLTPAAYLTTDATATYRGDAHGLYLGRDTIGEFGGEFQGDVRLTATFGGTPAISGSISGFQERAIGETDFSSLADNPALTLESATIDGTSAGGFFTGNTRATATMGGAIRTFSGKWGGQFYGSQANSVGGTFGGSTSGNPDGYELNFIGAFGAYKQ